ncbi:MAG: GNAT family N-acetyltransferase [Candidatus Kerfeldbacteria bacterium]
MTQGDSARFTYLLEPSNDWISSCKLNKSIVHNIDWQALLQKSFDIKTIYVWDEVNSDGFTISVFSVGPFHIGYIGFPTGGTIKGKPIDIKIINGLQENKLPLKIHAIRFTNSSFMDKQIINLPSELTNETSIEKLWEWKQENLPKAVRSDIRKSKKNGVEIDNAIGLKDGVNIYELYRKTIKRNKGNERYNSKYFEQLIELSKNNKDIQCIKATYNNKTAGFVVLLIQNKIAYYLHSVYVQELQRFRSSDLLLNSAIDWCKIHNIEKFNFMSSPIGNESLEFYKRKWGGETRLQKTYTIILNPIMMKLFDIGNYVRNKIFILLRWK